MTRLSSSVVRSMPWVSSCSTASSQPLREDEEDRREEVLLPQAVEDLQAGGARHARLGPPLPPSAPALTAVLERADRPDEVRVRLRRRTRPEEAVDAPVDQHVVVEGDGPVLGHDDVQVAADLPQPRAELLRVRHRRGQPHDPHVRGEVDDDLLPHGAAEAVRQVVDLVEDDEPQGGEVVARVEHVPQHLRRHDDDGGGPVDGRVARQEPHLVGAEVADELRVLLVAERLDGRGVEDADPAVAGQGDGELRDDGLAGARGRGHQHGPVLQEVLAGGPLEAIEAEAQSRLELVQQVVGCGHALSPPPDRPTGPP